MDIDRRGLLIGAAAVGGGLVVGTLGDRLGWWDIEILGPADPDEALRRTAQRGEAELVRAYDTALADPAVAALAIAAPMLAFRQHHVDHLAALGGGEEDVAAAPAPGQSGDADGAEPPVAALPADPAGLPAYFQAIEQGHLDTAATGALVGTDGRLARLLALIAAGESGHVARWTSG